MQGWPTPYWHGRPQMVWFACANHFLSAAPPPPPGPQCAEACGAGRYQSSHSTQGSDQPKRNVLLSPDRYPIATYRVQNQHVLKAEMERRRHSILMWARDLHQSINVTESHSEVLTPLPSQPTPEQWSLPWK